MEVNTTLLDKLAIIGELSKAYQRIACIKDTDTNSTEVQLLKKIEDVVGTIVYDKS